jgi:hypothetical protein
MIGSVPVTLVVMFWIVRSVTARYLPSKLQGQQVQEEESEGGTTSS